MSGSKNYFGSHGLEVQKVIMESSMVEDYDDGNEDVCKDMLLLQMCKHANVQMCMFSTCEAE